MPRRVDLNQPAIFAGLRDCGYLVQDTSAVGKGFPDAIAGAPWGQIFLLEVKGEDGELNARQVKWHATWHRQPVLVVRSVADAVAQMTALREPRQR